MTYSRWMKRPGPVFIADYPFKTYSLSVSERLQSYGMNTPEFQLAVNLLLK